MHESLTKVKCQHDECSHFQEYQDGEGLAWCSHPDKMHYMKSHPCPLFRLNIRRTANEGGMSGSAMDLLKMVRKR